MSRSTRLAAAILGASSGICQIVLLRETLTVFHGNELVMGIVLGNWLLLTGLGAWLRGHFKRFEQPFYQGLAFILSGLAPPLQLIALRTYKGLAGGALLGLGESFLVSFLVLLPYCLLSGWLLASLSTPAAAAQDSRPAADVYAWDTLGGFLGGLLFSFLLIEVLDPVQITLLVTLLGFFSAAVLWSGTQAGAALTAGVVLLLLFPLTVLLKLDLRSAQLAFPDELVVSQRATPYGSLVLTRRDAQLTLYHNGSPVANSQDVIAREEIVHYGMLQHPSPRAVLLISGGLSGALQEILKYPVERVDYVELDPAVPAFAAQLGVLPHDARVKMYALDARRFVRQSYRRYDVILSALPDPSSAQINRYYTIEFFREIKRALRPDGIFSFSLTGAENYLSGAVRELNASVLSSLAAVFPRTLLVPGGRTVFLSSLKPLDYGFPERLRVRGIKTDYVNADYLNARLAPDRLQMLDQLQHVPVSPNQDLAPVSYLLQLRFWLHHLGGSFAAVIWGAVLLSGMALLLTLRAPSPTVAFAIGSSGAAGICLELIFILTFQIGVGFVYGELALILSAFLAGAGMGALQTRTPAGSALARLLMFEFLIAAAALSWALWGAQVQSTFIFIGATAVVGYLTGAEFPLAAHITHAHARRDSRLSAASVFSADFIWASLGAFLCVSMLIPTFGVVGACYSVAALKIGSLCLVAVQGGALSRSAAEVVDAPSQTATLSFAVYGLFALLGVLIYYDRSNLSLYSLSFWREYHWLVLLILAWGIVRAIRRTTPENEQPRPPATYRLPLWRMLAQRIGSGTRFSLFGWVNFIALGLVVFYPIFRCFFAIPYLFCHVCPRKCVFGFLRPYLVPAALLMNVERRYWCAHACPVGSLQECGVRTRGKAASLPRLLKALPYLGLGLTACFYFRLLVEQQAAVQNMGDWFTYLYRNQYAPDMLVLLTAVLLLCAGFILYRPFCSLFCPIGACSRMLQSLGSFFYTLVYHRGGSDKEQHPL